MGSILPCSLPYGNAGGLQILRCQGFEVKYYDFTLDALTLKPSEVCNVGDRSSARKLTMRIMVSFNGIFAISQECELTDLATKIVDNAKIEFALVIAGG